MLPFTYRTLCPSIWFHILGEATSALDTLMRGRTTLIIADRIVVLEGRRIAATGTHAELLATSPTYRELYEAQLARSVSPSSPQSGLPAVVAQPV